jgi:hypothetical protein
MAGYLEAEAGISSLFPLGYAIRSRCRGCCPAHHMASRSSSSHLPGLRFYGHWLLSNDSGCLRALTQFYKFVVVIVIIRRLFLFSRWTISLTAVMEFNFFLAGSFSFFSTPIICHRSSIRVRRSLLVTPHDSHFGRSGACDRYIHHPIQTSLSFLLAPCLTHLSSLFFPSFSLHTVLGT